MSPPLGFGLPVLGFEFVELETELERPVVFRKDEVVAVIFC